MILIDSDTETRLSGKRRFRIPTKNIHGETHERFESILDEATGYITINRKNETDQSKKGKEKEKRRKGNKKTSYRVMIEETSYTAE